MAAPRDMKPSWGDVAARIAQQLGLTTDRSSTLRKAIERGVKYIALSEKELIFDTRALFLGLLAAGTEDRDSIRYGNAATWFWTWLCDQIGEATVIRTLAREPMAAAVDVFPRLADGYRLRLSFTVRDLGRLAAEIAEQTVRRPLFEARHLMAAMIIKGTIAERVLETFQHELVASDLVALKIFLVDRIMETPEAGERRESWLQAMSLPAATAAGADDKTPPAVRDGIVPFSRDATQRGSDVLETAADARALARLICLRDSTPLAVAIFGGWGSGKSTFMERLDAEVGVIVRQEAKRLATSKGAESDSNLFIGRVVQMRFNAWQFVDANLWASLASEFFDQLRAGGWNRTSKIRHAGLVERVNRHVHALSADAEARRQAAIEGGRGVLRAQRARDAAAKAAREAEGETLGQAAVDALRDLYEARKADLTALGLRAADVDAGAAVDAVVNIVRSSNSIVGQARQIVAMIAKSWTRLAVALLSLVVLAVAGYLLATYLRAPNRSAEGTLAALFTTLGAIGTAAAAAAPAVRVVRSIAKRGADIARALNDDNEAAVKILVQKEVELREMTAEAEALAEATERADRALARYVDPRAASNPPRLLRYVLEDDPDTKALESEIGLIGRTRRLFQAVDDIVREERKKKPEERLDGDVPDRIVLYIDDLDRCTEEQVYAVLQAIHLLLAFELFAVVVGVDVAWIENALSKMFGDHESGGGPELDRRQRAVRYLEKIFQVAFWLAPLSAAGSDGGSFARYVKQLATPSPPAPPEPTPPLPIREAAALADGAPAAEQADRVGAEGEGPVETTSRDASGDEAGDGDPEVAADPAGPAAFETIKLEDIEIEFLASPAIAAIAAATPRSVKRLVNVYRLVRTRLVESGGTPMGGGGRAPDYPLIALTVAIETGQTIEIADAFLQGLEQMGSAAKLSRAAFAKLLKVEPGADIDKLPPMAKALAKSPDLLAAIERVLVLRANRLTAADALRVAKLARRYSFNRYQ